MEKKIRKRYTDQTGLLPTTYPQKYTAWLEKELIRKETKFSRYRAEYRKERKGLKNKIEELKVYVDDKFNEVKGLEEENRKSESTSRSICKIKKQEAK